MPPHPSSSHFSPYSLPHPLNPSYSYPQLAPVHPWTNLGKSWGGSLSRGREHVREWCQVSEPEQSERASVVHRRRLGICRGFSDPKQWKGGGASMKNRGGGSSWASEVQGRWENFLHSQSSWHHISENIPETMSRTWTKSENQVYIGKHPLLTLNSEGFGDSDIKLKTRKNDLSLT